VRWQQVSLIAVVPNSSAQGPDSSIGSAKSYSAEVVDDVPLEVQVVSFDVFVGEAFDSLIPMVIRD
jgi:hypothetical protein